MHVRSAAMHIFASCSAAPLQLPCNNARELHLQTHAVSWPTLTVGVWPTHGQHTAVCNIRLHYLMLGTCIHQPVADRAASYKARWCTICPRYITESMHVSAKLPSNTCQHFAFTDAVCCGCPVRTSALLCGHEQLCSSHDRLAT